MTSLDVWSAKKNDDNSGAGGERKQDVAKYTQPQPVDECVRGLLHTQPSSSAAASSSSSSSSCACCTSAAPSLFNPFCMFRRTTRDVGVVRRVYIILNPYGGNGRGLKAWREFKHVLDNRGTIQYELIETQHSGHATEVMRDLKFDDGDDEAVVVIGGDGSLTEVAAGMLSRPDKRTCPLLFVAGGTGNSVCQTLCQMSATRAAELLYEGVVRPIDVGQIECGNAGEKRLYMLNTLNVGLASAANERAEGLRCFGRQRYKVAAVMEVLNGTRFHGTCTFDGHHRLECETFQTITLQANQHYGNNFRIAPYAQLDDGLFDAVIQQYQGRCETIGQLLNIEKGVHLSRSSIQYYRFESVRVESSGNGEEAVFYVDGDYGGVTPFTLNVLKQCLPIYVDTRVVGASHNNNNNNNNNK